MKTIPLTWGKVAIIDDEDFEKVNKYKWYASKEPYTFYARRRFSQDGKRHNESMHRYLLNVKSNQDVDHINHNGLDNCRKNLRTCTRSQNNGNARKFVKSSSKFKGVTWDKSKRKWQAQITHNRTNINLGRFSDEVLAAKAYDGKARELFGDFAFLNFPAEE